VEEQEKRGFTPPCPSTGRLRYVIVSTLPRLEIASGEKRDKLLGLFSKLQTHVFFSLLLLFLIFHKTELMEKKTNSDFEELHGNLPRILQIFLK
jgi:hypothetical protein